MIKVQYLDRNDDKDSDGGGGEVRGPRVVRAWLVLLMVVVSWVGGYWLGKAGASASSASVSPSASASSSSSVSGSGSVEPTAVVSRGDEVAPGLRMGLATVAAGNSGAKYGIPYGWSRTTDGAVGAAMNIAASFCALPMMVDSTRVEIDKIQLTADGLVENTRPLERAAKMRKGSRLNNDGVVVLPDGRPSPHEKYYGCGLPRYGAYKVISEEDYYVIVEVWMPYVAGPGTDDNLSEVFLGTIHGELAMRWDRGPVGPDWRLAHDKPLPVLDLPTRKSNVGWQGIRDIVGPGWMVPADATTKPYPGSVWAS